MLRPLLTLAARGAAGILAWQLLWAPVLPLVVGILAIAIKIAFWVALIAVAIWVFRRLFRSSETPA
ncbi:MAG: hypothetical protein HY700_10015 [Gemmatimonadetes bacterium]|nr:hypothetical protein [Gemmatimonadota bacterium]